jgi:hypothetical protein
MGNLDRPKPQQTAVVLLSISIMLSIIYFAAYRSARVVHVDMHF